MRSAAALLVALVLAGIAGLAISAVTENRPQAFTLGVPRAAPLKVKASKEACQAPIEVPVDAAFEGVTFAVGTGGRAGPDLSVAIRAGGADGRTLARGTLAAGYADVAEVAEHTVWMARVPAEQTIAVCVTNRGKRAAYLYGAADAASVASTGTVNGKALGADFSFDFDRREAATVSSLIPAMFERAARFQADGIGPWTYWLLVLLALGGVPALLLGALRAAQRER